MQFSTLAVAAFAAFTSAAAIQARSELCEGIATPQCCQVSVDGILDLTCNSPEPDLSSVSAFQSSCASSGTVAQCCILPIAGEALLCTDA